MNIFESIPRTIQAEQFHADAGGKMKNDPAPAGACFCTTKLVGAHVHPWEGEAFPLRDGDWIVPAPDGEHFFPIPNHFFPKLYRAVAQATSA